MPNDARTMPKACSDARGHDHAELSIRTIADRLNQRSKVIETASTEASQDGARNGAGEFPSPAPVSLSNVGPLPGLEPLGIEKAGHNSTANADLDHQPCYAPLPGTSTSQVIEISRGSSRKRSPESICYPKLLRENGPSSGRKSRKTASVEGRVCST